VDKIWCAWEEAEFDDNDAFELYQGGPLRKHKKGVTTPHLTNGIALGGPGPGPGGGFGATDFGRDVTYGYGPMGDADRDG
jgi:hypothetical protein